MGNSSVERFVEGLASGIVRRASRTFTIMIVLMLVAAWGIAGFYFHFSDKWQMAIETCSSVVTLVMVFLILKAQVKDSLSVQLKLNELVAANAIASNRLVDIEGMTEDELKVIQKYYTRLGEFAKKKESLQEAHSIDEQHDQHTIKKELESELKELKDLTDLDRGEV